MKRSPYVAPEQPPDDVVTGPDLAAVASLTLKEVRAVRVTCHHGACTFSVLVELAAGEVAETIPLHRVGDMLEHVTLGHPAVRNPATTCQAAPTWDHERWCVRPVGHDDRGHWTPSFHGGHWWRVR